MLFLLTLPVVGLISAAWLDVYRYRQVCFVVLLLSFGFGLYLLLEWQVGFAWGEMVVSSLFGFVLPLGLDVVNVPFVFLTLSLMPITYVASVQSISVSVKFYISVLMVTHLVVLVTFLSQDLFLFYLAFEASLIPVFVLIGYWGSRSQKVQASYYFFYYSLVGSLLMLSAILLVLSEVGTTNLDHLLLLEFDPVYQRLAWLGFSIAITAKLPLIPLHIWLPQAHVEAPLAGSMILAGLLLKLGGFAYLKYVLPLWPDGTAFYGSLWQVLGVVGVVYASLSTLRQIDMKRAIAYSSIAHMSTVTIGLLSATPESVSGAVLVMVAHGYVSAGLFLSVTLLYQRHGSRLIKYYRGMCMSMPVYALLVVVLTFSSMAVPPSAGFVGELLVFIGTYEVSPMAAVLAGVGVILSAAYSLFLANRICFGGFSPYIVEGGSIFSTDVTRVEFHALFPLVFYSLLLGLCPGLIIAF